MKSRKCYTATEKLSTVSYAESHGNRAASRHFSINEANIRSWRKNKDALRMLPSQRKANRGLPASYRDLEKILKPWVVDKRDQGIRVSRAEIRHKALELTSSTATQFRASYGWAVNFLKRSGLLICSSTAQHGQENEINIENCDDLNPVNIRSETDELVTKEKLEEVAEEHNRLVNGKSKTYFPLLCNKGFIANNKEKMDKYDEFNPFNPKLEVEELVIKDKPVIVKSETNLPTFSMDGSCDFNHVDIKIEREELLIKDEPEEVVEESEINSIKVDPFVIKYVEVDKLPSKMSNNFNSNSKIEETELQCDEQCLVENSSLTCQRTDRHKCNKCGKQFTQLGPLKMHARTHTGEKPYGCPQCQKCFTQNCSLQRHMLLHNGEKSFKCYLCRQTFKKNASLKAHLLIHKHKKSFKCGQCDKTFIRNAHLSRHIAVQVPLVRQSFHSKLQPQNAHVDSRGQETSQMPVW